MNILYIASTDFFQKPNPSFHLMKAMIDDLLQDGHTVYYVGVAISDHDKHVPEDLLNDPEFHCSLVEMPPVPKNKFVNRYLEGIRYAFKAKKFIKEYVNHCNVIFIQSSATVLYNILVARNLAGKDKKIVWNVQDMFPGSSIASGVMKNRLQQVIFEGMQRIAYRKADIIVGISEDMKIKLIEQGVPESKVRVILNWFDDQTVSEVPRDQNRFIKKYDMKEDKFYVQYAGTMGYVFDYRMVLAVASRLTAYNDIVFHMIGEGSQKEVFVAEAKDRALHSIQFLPLEPQNMVSDVYSACDVCLIPLKHGVIGNSVPSKAGLLMACKRPIVTSADRGCYYAKEISDSGVGFACSDDDPDSVANHILDLYNNRQLGVEMGKKGYEYGHVRYARSTNMRDYIKLFKELA